MFEALRIINFQGHRRLRIEFNSGVTTIVGPSDAGKSAVLRALRWLCFNKPRGDAFIRDGAPYVAVTLFVDGYQITRKKGKTNLYAMRSQGEEEGVTYNAFGSDIPDDIAALLNLDVVNFQEQHDAPFWFCESPGQVSKELNAIVDLGIIDTTLSALGANLRSAKGLVGVIEEKVREAKVTVDEFADVPAMDRALCVVETFNTQYKTIASQRRSIGLLVEQVSHYRQTTKRLEERATGARKLLKLGETAMNAADRVDQLTKLGKRLVQVKRDAVSIDFSPVEEAKTKCVTVDLLSRGLNTLVHKLTQETARLNQAETSVQAAHDIIERECEGVCPLCGRE